MPRDKVKFRYAFERMEEIDYWSKVISIGKYPTLSRVNGAMTIMDRGDEAELDTLFCLVDVGGTGDPHLTTSDPSLHMHNGT